MNCCCCKNHACIYVYIYVYCIQCPTHERQVWRRIAGEGALLASQSTVCMGMQQWKHWQASGNIWIVPPGCSKCLTRVRQAYKTCACIRRNHLLQQYTQFVLLPTLSTHVQRRDGDDRSLRPANPHSTLQQQGQAAVRMSKCLANSVFDSHPLVLARNRNTCGECWLLTRTLLHACIWWLLLLVRCTAPRHSLLSCLLVLLLLLHKTGRHRDRHRLPTEGRPPWLQC